MSEAARQAEIQKRIKRLTGKSGAKRRWPRDRARRHHIGVYALTVEKQWSVGRATFYPAGWLRRRLESIQRRRWEEHRDNAHLEWERDNLDKELSETKWATASAVGIDVAAARDEVRDAIALLRLYQRSLSGMNLDRQTFGLRPDVGFSIEHSYVMTKGRIVLSSGGVQGIPPPGWTFKAQDIDQFSDRAEFAYLDRALEASPKDDLQKRTTTALRFLNIATAMLPEPVRVVLIATAFEELLADQERGERRTRLARRAAYLTCARDRGDGYGAGGRPACLYLAGTTSKAVQASKATVRARGGDPYCSWYEDVRILFNVRDLVLHQRLEKLPRSAAANFEAQTDEAIIRLAAWAAASGATEMGALDDEIDTYVATSYRDWPTPPEIPSQP